MLTVEILVKYKMIGNFVLMACYFQIEPRIQQWQRLNIASNIFK